MSSGEVGWKLSVNQARACRRRGSRRKSYSRSIRFTSSYVIWAMANPPGLTCRIRLRGFLQRIRYAGKFDALHARYGYALLEKLRLNAAPQLPRHFILARRRGSHLQSNRGSMSVKILNAQDPWHIHKRSEEHTSELQSRGHLVCRLLLEKKNKIRLSA